MCADEPGSEPNRATGAITRAAARWLARRDRGLLASEQIELEQWKAADPRHAAELASLEAEWRLFDDAKFSPELVALAAAVKQQPLRRPHRPIPGGSRVLAAAAAAIVLLGGLTWWNVSSAGKREQTDPQPTYRVIASAAHRMPLDDGSVVDVREAGEISVQFTAPERRVRLVRGEAHFTVAPDPSRPFIVEVGDTAVRAVGTAFNVRLESHRVEVLVTEGKVQVANTAAFTSGNARLLPLVHAGEKAVVARESNPALAQDAASVDVAPAASADVEKALAWQSARLVFDRTPLDEAVEAFNRHSPSGHGIQLVIGDATLRTRRLGGTIRAANVEAFVRLLEQSIEVRAEHRGGQIVLLPVR